MQRVELQPAWVLHERPYRETSLLVELLTRDHGRVGVVARGVRSARPRVSRGVLRPLQELAVGYVQRGELGTLTGAEITATALAADGRALRCALYANELTARLLPRQDPHPDVFFRYGRCLAELVASAGHAQAWALRRYERDLLAALGYALVPEFAGGGGSPIEDDRVYRFDPDAGFRTVGARAADPGIVVPGAALRALASEALPAPEALRALRDLMRAVIRHHLGGRELAAWRLLDSTSPALTRPAADRRPR